MISAFSGVLLRHPLAIAAAGDVLYPPFVLKIPAHGLLNPTFKRFPGMPIQFACDFPRIHRVSAVVARTVLYERDKLPVWNDRIAGPQLVEQAAERLHDVEILLLVG